MKNKPESWENRFDKKWYILFASTDGHMDSYVYQMVREFCESELARARAEVHEQYRPLVRATEKMSANIERWLKTGECATPDESEKLYTDLKSALAKAKGE